eukprot:m.715088 g.715088  ORF g.715088 m.715088 type:complete len:533 (+) comp22976_c0_seq3:408-2006(+)
MVFGALMITAISITIHTCWESMANPLPDYPMPFDTRVQGNTALFGRCMGHTGEFAMALLLVPVTRNGLLVHTTGMPFERALAYHRALGRVSVFFITIHAIVWWCLWIHQGTIVQNGITFTGYYECLFGTENGGGGGNATIASATWAWVFIVLMTVAAIDVVRRKRFEWFYHVHQLYILVLPLAAWHSFVSGGFLVPFLMFTGLMFVADYVFRIFRVFSRRPNHVIFERKNGGVVRIAYSVKALGGSYTPGQYCFLCIPEVSVLQWHPFSISSAPDGKRGVVTHHIKNMGAGSWTDALHHRIPNVSWEASSSAANTLGTVLVDGPYGSPGVDIDKSGAIVLVCGGVGVTPLISFLVALHRGTLARGPLLQDVHFCWTVRDLHAISWFADELRAIADDKVGLSADGSRAVRFHLHLYCTKKHAPSETIQNTDLSLVSTTGGTREPLLANVADVYEDLETTTPAGGEGLATKLEIHAGRPDLPTLINGIVDGGPQSRGEVTSVWVCGPPRMVATVSAVAMARQTHIAYHEEIFAF